MKFFRTILIVVLCLFLLACDNDKQKKRKDIGAANDIDVVENPDSDGGSSDTGDTADSGDTADTGDTADGGDTGDTGTDTGDTGTDTGDTGTDTGDTGTDTGDTGTDTGDTGNTGDGCKSNSECGNDQYCKKSEGMCSGTGSCEDIPWDCPPRDEPVCACDGHTYPDACVAALQGVSVDYQGECNSGQGCSTNEECGMEMFCKKKDGQCDGNGVCMPIPEECPWRREYVCGCDGNTYRNSCRAEEQGVSVLHEGECGGPIGCMENSDCGDGLFCSFEYGVCGGSGECKAKPQSCEEYYEPVCGCDDNTYENSCLADKNGISVAFEGGCDSTDGKVTMKYQYDKEQNILVGFIEITGDSYSAKFIDPQPFKEKGGINIGGITINLQVNKEPQSDSERVWFQLKLDIGMPGSSSSGSANLGDGDNSAKVYSGDTFIGEIRGILDIEEFSPSMFQSPKLKFSGSNLQFFKAQ